jgi:hypothetical protein
MAKRRFFRSALALLLAVNHLLVATGLPVPLPARDTERSSREMFPCMNCSCGCRTAEQCWRHCCCYTMTEKVAWAKAHGVTPPAFVVEAAAREAASAADADDHKPCCPDCHKKAAAAPEPPPRDDGQTDRIILLKVLECQGHGPFGLLAASPALIPPPVAFVATGPRILGYAAHWAPALVSAFADVPVPPPRG